MTDDLHGSPSGHKESILEHSTNPRERPGTLLAHLPNLLTLSRFALAAIWIAIAFAIPLAHPALAAIAIFAAVTDFIDGRVARRLGVAYERGGWLDSIADVTFVLSALCCYAAVDQLPWAIPFLIAVSFSQYAVDSMWLHRAGGPVKSRLGHWGGIINYALVLAMSLTTPASAVRTYMSGLFPVIELFYIAAIIERSLTYQRIRRR